MEIYKNIAKCELKFPQSSHPDFDRFSSPINYLPTNDEDKIDFKLLKRPISKVEMRDR